MILGEQHPARVPELDGFDVAQPEYGRRLTGGQCRAAADLDQTLSPDAFADELRLRCRAPIAAEDRGPNRIASRIDKHAAGLAGQSQAADLATGFRGDGGQDIRRGAPPIPGILFDPAGTRGLGPIPERRRSDDPPGLIDRDGMGALGANVETEQH